MISGAERVGGKSWGCWGFWGEGSRRALLPGGIPIHDFFFMFCFSDWGGKVYDND